MILKVISILVLIIVVIVNEAKCENCDDLCTEDVTSKWTQFRPRIENCIKKGILKKVNKLIISVTGNRICGEVEIEGKNGNEFCNFENYQSEHSRSNSVSCRSNR